MAIEQVEKLAEGIKAVLARTDDPSEITKAVAALAKPLADDQSWVTEAHYHTEDSQGIGIRVMHEEPDHSIAIQTVCWMPGRGVKPHDHRTWGVVIGLDGVEKNIAWRRLDDGSKPGYAELEPFETIMAGRGDVVRLKPTDIHSVTNEGSDKSLSLHIYGRSLAHTNRSEFEPDEKIERPCPQRIRSRS